jgi:endoglucanase
MRKPVRYAVTAAVLAGALAACGGTYAATPAALAVRVSGNQLVNGQGQPVRLLGVDVTGTEDACIQNKGFSWGASSTPTQDAASAVAMKTWGINAVRIPLNEDCWLDINGAPAAYSGASYQTMIKDWVTALNNAGIYTILDLHWAAPNGYEATGQLPMADADNSLTFWTQVASNFKSDPAVIFDPFNEPYLGQSNPTAADWTCWLNGCTNTTPNQANSVSGTIRYQEGYSEPHVVEKKNRLRAAS